MAPTSGPTSAASAARNIPQAGLRGAQGNSQLPRHLAVGKTLEVRKLQRLSLYRGKPCDRGADLRATNPNPSGLDHLVAGGFRGGVVMGFIPAPQRCFVADGIDGFVVNCGEEVGGDTPAGGVEPGGTLPDRQEGLLHHVLGDGAVVADPEGKTKRLGAH